MAETAIELGNYRTRDKLHVVKVLEVPTDCTLVLPTVGVVVSSPSTSRKTAVGVLRKGQQYRWGKYGNYLPSMTPHKFDLVEKESQWLKP